VISIRALRPDEFDQMTELWKEAGLACKPRGRDQRAHIEREISGPTSIFLMAEEDGRMVGVVLGTHDGRKGWINRLAVAPGYQRRGIGRALASAVEARLRQAGIGIVTCLIEDWNAESIEFFEEIGYVGHREIIYFAKRMNPDV
jgi:ribosomal protein S18 acetylase RimI-like enzyme